MSPSLFLFSRSQWEALLIELIPNIHGSYLVVDRRRGTDYGPFPRSVAERLKAQMEQQRKAEEQLEANVATRETSMGRKL